MSGYLLSFQEISLLVLLAAGLVTLLFTKKYSMSERLGIAVLVPLAFIVVWNWWNSLVVNPISRHWSGPRLAPALSILHGYKLYQPPDRGPVSGWIYPPVSALSYLPATLLRDPTAMVLCGRVLSLVFYYGTVSWLLIREVRCKRIAPLAAALLFVIFALLTDGAASLRYVSTEILADTPALAFGTVALSLVGTAGGAFPGRRAALAISACTLAAWSKQLAVPLLLVPTLWGACTGGWKGLGRWLLLSAAVVGAISLPIAGIFAPRELYFNTVVVPSWHPWLEETLPGICQAVLAGLDDAWSLKAFLGLGLVSMGVVSCIQLLGREAIRCDCFLWIPFFLAGVLELPFSALGKAKLGGDVNSLSHVLLYWSIASVLVMGGLSVHWSQTSWVLLAIAIALGIHHGGRIWDGGTRRDMGWIQEQQMVVRYLKSHPGEAYFPWHPLEHLAVEGRMTHFEYGVFDRALAGRPVSISHLRQYIPPATRRLCYPPDLFYTRAYQLILRTLPEFNRRVVIDELPGYYCYERAASAFPGSSHPRHKY